MADRESAKVDYLIIGGGLSSVYAAQAIRERDGVGSVALVTEESHIPYDRVPLSKGYLVGRVRQESLFPRKPDFFEKQNIQVVIGRRATALDAASKAVLLDDGTEFSFRRLLLATGGKPRKIRVPGSDLKGIYYLRTVDDCDAIKAEILRAKKAVIVGGGFIGCELAAAFSIKGIDTTVVEALPSILSLAFDLSTATWIEEYFASKGVKIFTNARVTEFVGEGGRVTGIRAGDGSTIQGDLVVVGIGIVPDSELAERAGLKVENGIVVDEFLQTSVSDIYAAGDVARFFHPAFGRYIRVEHYDVAVRHGRLAGANMAGARQPFVEMPYFFSYMFDLTTKAYGDLSRRETTIRRGELGLEGFFQFFFVEGKLQAFLSMNRPNEEIQFAKGILLRRPGIEELSSIGDESRSLRTFAPG